MSSDRQSLWRRVFHKYWWTLGWNSTNRGPGRRFLTWSICLSNTNRPHLNWGWEPGFHFVSFEWGNGNSDPVFSVGIQGKG